MSIGKTIYTLLSTDNTLTAIIPATRMFPYVMEENTPLPALIYTIDAIVPEYTKDGWELDECTFNVISFSDNYTVLQSIVQAIRGALEFVKTSKTHRIYMTGQSEGFNITENVFMNRLTFRADVIEQ